MDAVGTFVFHVVIATMASVAGLVGSLMFGWEGQKILFLPVVVAEGAPALGPALREIRQDGAIWISWPKRTSGVSTDVTEDVVREHALPLSLVDVKVCAVDATWSALKLVIRKGQRHEWSCSSMGSAKKRRPRERDKPPPSTPSTKQSIGTGVNPEPCSDVLAWPEAKSRMRSRGARSQRGLSGGRPWIATGVPKRPASIVARLASIATMRFVA